MTPKDLQAALTSAGFNPGPADGLWGTRTSGALRAWFTSGRGLFAPPPPPGAFKFTAKSEAALKGVHPDLVRVMRRAIASSPIEFIILEGLRSVAQQKVNVAKGASKTMNSKHLTGHAVDAIPLVNGGVTWSWPIYYKLAPIIKAAAKVEGVTVTWGGDWKSFKDGPHWELDPKNYPIPK